jgi:excisionase family DNA binding protein
MEQYMMTIKDVAEYMQLAEQTIQRYVLKREIPFHKVKKVIRFRLSEIDQWIDKGGGKKPEHPGNDREGDLFADVKTAEAGTDGNADKSGESGEPEGEQA